MPVTAAIEEAANNYFEPKGKEATDMEIEDIPKHVADKLSSFGRNEHMPVCTVAEVIYCRRLGDADAWTADGSQESTLRAAGTHCPLQPLPAANTATVHDRWRSWNCVNVDGSGRSIESRRISHGFSSGCGAEGIRSWPGRSGEWL